MSVVKQKASPPSQPQTQDNASQLNTKIVELRQKFNALRDYLNSKVVGHQEMVDAILLGLLAGENVVMIGAPGTAKSMIATLLADAIQGAKVFKYLLTKYTDYAELFGTIDVSELAKGNYTRRWSPIVSSDIIFLDEIFKANSAILNSLLSLLNEHIIYDSMTGQSIPTSNKLVIGASNEIPEEEELRALYDRFPIKIFVKYISTSHIDKALEATWLGSGIQKPNLTINDVIEAQELVTKIFTATINTSAGAVTPIEYYKFILTTAITELRQSGIMLSDRTIISKIPKIISAKILLDGADAVFTAPFEAVILSASTPEEKQKAEEIIRNTLSKANEVINKYNQALELLESNRLNEAEALFKEVTQYDISKMPNYLAPVVREIVKNAETALKMIEDYRNEMKRNASKLGVRFRFS